MDQETKDRIVALALIARSYLAQGKFDGYTGTLSKLWNTIDEYEFTDGDRLPDD